MVEREPVTDPGPFSSDGVVATEWAKALADLQGAEVYWLSTVLSGWASPRHPAF